MPNDRVSWCRSAAAARRFLVRTMLLVGIALPVAAHVPGDADTTLLDSAPFAGRSLPSPDELVAIPPELDQRLAQEVVAASAPGRARLTRLFDFVTRADGLGVRYNPGANRSVAGTWRARDGNCVSLALFFAVLAERAGLSVAAQESRVPLDLTTRAERVIELGHAAAVIRIDGVDYEVDLTGNQRIDGFGNRRIDLVRLEAEFYNNVAVRALAGGDAATASAALTTALTLDPAFDGAHNTLGVIALARHDHAAARSAFDAALALAPDNVEALANRIALADADGDAIARTDAQQRLARLRRQDPAYHFLVGAHALAEQRYADALPELTRAARLLPHTPAIYDSLAATYLGLHDASRAAWAARRAERLRSEEQRRYLVAPEDRSANGK